MIHPGLWLQGWLLICILYAVWHCYEWRGHPVFNVVLIISRIGGSISVRHRAMKAHNTQEQTSCTISTPNNFDFFQQGPSISRFPHHAGFPRHQQQPLPSIPPTPPLLTQAATVEARNNLLRITSPSNFTFPPSDKSTLRAADDSFLELEISTLAANYRHFVIICQSLVSSFEAVLHSFLTTYPCSNDDIMIF